MAYTRQPDLSLFDTLSQDMRDLYHALPFDYRPLLSDYIEAKSLIQAILEAWETYQLEVGK